ncbi:MAG: acyl-ACP desaturase [Algiphilus sp.]|nr:acyl-ACP desaturase [Algiphilus sp.]
MTGHRESITHDLHHRLDVVRSLEERVREETAAHIARRNLWMPDDLNSADLALGEEHDQSLRELRERARGLPVSVRAAVALNLLTEEGLPHFHRLIATHFPEGTAWREWNNMWTAEEDRHGCALRDYVRDARLFHMRIFEQEQYEYIAAGFDPHWEQDPYRLLAYTSLQERATQYAHANTGRLARGHEPMLQRVLAHLAGDESRHYQFYRAVFADLLREDPNRALVSLLKVTVSFAMPGHAIGDFEALSDLVAREDIFGTAQYRDIVVELLDYWKIGDMTGLSAEGAKAQERLMKMPSRLERMLQTQQAKREARTFQFDFIGEQRIRI